MSPLCTFASDAPNAFGARVGASGDLGDCLPHSAITSAFFADPCAGPAPAVSLLRALRFLPPLKSFLDGDDEAQQTDCSEDDGEAPMDDSSLFIML
jgi:hypothetical protein